MKGAALSVANLTLDYDRHPAVHHLSGVFPAGSLTAVVGPNGGGKSTLLKGLACLKKPAEGRIDRGGLTQRDLGYLPQQVELDHAFPITVLDMVSLGLWRRAGPFGGWGREGVRRAEAALAQVELAGLEGRSVGSLSSGQFQRLLFARLLVQDAPVLLLDEPFAYVDARTTADLLALIAAWHAEGRTVIAVLHDIDQVVSYFPQALLLARECLGWGPTAQVLTAERLAEARRIGQDWHDRAPVCRADAA